MAIMIGTHPPQKALFSYRINLNQRVRDNHPLRKILEVVDFGFVRAEVASFYGCTRASPASAAPTATTRCSWPSPASSAAPARPATRSGPC
jgi:hypothetical protein